MAGSYCTLVHEQAIQSTVNCSAFAEKIAPMNGPLDQRVSVMTVLAGCYTSSLETYHFMNEDVGHDKLDPAVGRPAKRQVLSCIKSFCLGAFQRQVNPNREVAERDGIVVELGVFWCPAHGRKIQDVHHVPLFSMGVCRLVGQ